MSLSVAPRRLPAVLLALAAVLVLASCGGSGADATAEDASGGGDAFPVRVDHRFGTTVVPQRPRRIVVVGLTEQDIVLALGEKPVGVTEWYGEQPSAVWPWARRELGESRPTVLSQSDGIQFERVAGLRPDLIVAVNGGIERADYEKLSRIAPTVSSAPGSPQYFSPWDQQTMIVARALGREARGRRLVADVKARFAAAVARYPRLRGRSVTFMQGQISEGNALAYQEGLGVEFLDMLGMRANPRLKPLESRPDEQVSVSAERLEVLEADAIIAATEEPAEVGRLLDVPTFRRLPAVRERRTVYTDGTLAAALYFSTPLSLRYVADRLPSQLDAAVAGRQPQRVLGGG